MEKRNALKVWTMLLAILAFSLSLLGTFLVRSGVLTSVHTFASDPTRGVFILAILVLFIGGGAGARIAWRAPRAASRAGCSRRSRARARWCFNNLFLTTACRDRVRRHALSACAGSVDRRQDFCRCAVLQSHLWPAVRADSAGDAVRSAAGLEARRCAGRRAAPDGERAALALVAAAAIFAVNGGGPVLAPFVIGLAVFVMGGARITDSGGAHRLFSARFPPVVALSRARGLPRSAWGTAIAHFGVGLTLLGIVSEATWGIERIVVAQAGNDVVSLRSYDLTFDGLTTRQGPNYRQLTAKFTVRGGRRGD